MNNYAKVEYMEYNKEITFSQELLRKTIHLISLSIPVVYIFVTREFALSVLIPLCILAIIIDYLSKGNNKVHYYLFKFFGKILRSHEVEKKYTLNGASWVLISAVICVYVFPKDITIVAFTILIISDTCAAIFGRKYGKHRLFDKKSWEGTGAFILSAWVVIVFYGFLFHLPNSYFLFGIFGGVAAGFAEAASGIMKVDDNLAIPISVGLLLLLGNYLTNFLM